ncbi:CLUMA_CG010983, isoform A [Clunio marinus]|uniref:CLUMA_CG010983, isoform A n=1 Tax=Clunio marinus TaxID=568069 RepID=A0A1J1IBD9_9DIPT|nr:CLUMA_CG010983, isoform A [Clunio marinus]
MAVLQCAFSCEYQGKVSVKKLKGIGYIEKDDLGLYLHQKKRKKLNTNINRTRNDNFLSSLSYQD